MNINIAPDPETLGSRAADKISECINAAIREKNHCRIILSTGSSQFETLSNLIERNIDWSKVEMFHLDEYIGLQMTHPASFRKYLYERFISRIKLHSYHFVDGEESISKLSKLFREAPIDIGVIGIGENGHIAFNDPPADFETEEIYKIVKLDQRCRMQQVGEGWFESINDVPTHAVTMCPKAIMSAHHLISAVPHKVKAEAVYNTITRPVSPDVPATLLKTHPDWHLFLDEDSASRLLGFQV